MKRITFLFAFVIAFVIYIINAFPVYAHDYMSSYEASFYGSENGYGMSSVNSVLCGSDGFVWVGTYTGLYRWNGTGFSAIGGDMGVSNVRTMIEANDGTIVIGTNDSGIAKFNMDGSFSFIKKSDGLPSNSIRSLACDKNGSVYIGSTSELAVVASDGAISKIYGEINGAISLCVCDNGDIAGVTNEGMLFIIRDKSIFTSYLENSDNSVYSCVCTAKDGKLIVGSSGTQIYQCELDGNKIISDKFVDMGKISGASAIKNIENGYMVCADNGIEFIDYDGIADRLDYQSFNSNITDVGIDYQGNIWFASARLGLMKLSENQFVNYSAEYMLGENVVNAVFRDDGLTYIGSDSGLEIVDEKKGKKTDNKLTQKLEGQRIRNIISDNKGLIWVCTYGTEGLFCYDAKHGGIINSYSESNSGTLGSKFRFANVLSDGTVLAATNVGLNYISGGKVVKTIGSDNGLKVQPLCAFEKDDGTILVGSDGDGIYIIKDGEVAEVIGSEQGLDSLVVMRIVKYDDVYIAVTGNGLYKITENGQASRLSNFEYTNNFDIIPSSNGKKLWILSSAGIFIADGETLINGKAFSQENCVLLSEKNGLNDAITANSWNCVDENGFLYLCCSTAVRKISMDKYSFASVPYKINVFAAELGDGNYIYPTSDIQGYDGQFTIPPDAGRISFDAAVLNYTLSDPEVYVYLEGFDNEPIVTVQSKLGKVSYTNIPNGTYKLHVSIPFTNSSVIYLVTKAPQFFETPLFRIYLVAVCVTMVIFITWIVTRLGSINVIKRQYEEIRNARDEAEKANNAKSSFLANVSHEIRTPINTILGMDEMILRENAGDVVEGYAMNIKKSGITLLSIVNDILDISKIEVGQMNIVESEYDIRSIIYDLINMGQMSCNEKKLTFYYKVDSTISRFLYGDEVKLQQIITNLLSNAVKYTESGCVKLTIHSENEDENGKVGISVSVSDTGIGIKDEDRERLFSPFERLEEKYTKHIEGTGLGLAITKKMLEMMGSKLEFTSKYGEGSCFGFLLRQKAVSIEKLGEITGLFGQSSDRYNYHVSFTAPDARILVVDDNRMNIEVITGLLNDTKIKIDTALCGEKALEMVKNTSYDLILLDHMMPVMDGCETLARIKAGENKCKNTPVIVLTANAVSGAKEKYIAAGFDDYLSKPVESKALEKMIADKLPEELCKKTAVKEDNEGMPVTFAGNCIDRNLGLKYTGGNEKLYRKMLDIYYSQRKENIDKLESFFNAGDIKNYEIVIHSLKSTSLGIGASELSEKAKALEFAAKDGNINYIRENHRITMDQYAEVTENIRRALESSTEIAEQPKTSSISTEMYRAEMQKLKSCISDFDADGSAEILGRLAVSECADVNLKENIGKLKELLDNFKWDEAEELIKKLIEV